MIRIKSITLFISILVFFTGCQTLHRNPKIKFDRHFGQMEFIFVQENKEIKETIGYKWLIPKEPESTQTTFPLVVAFHPHGVSGDDYLAILEQEAANHHMMLLIPDRINSFPGEISFTERYQRFIPEFLNEHPEVDQEKLILMGSSAGALIARWLLKDSLKPWKAVVFACSNPEDKWFETLDPKEAPPFLFIHGHQDEQYDFQKLVHTLAKMQLSGFDVTLFEDPYTGHAHPQEWNKPIFNWIERQLFQEKFSENPESSHQTITPE